MSNYLGKFRYVPTSVLTLVFQEFQLSLNLGNKGVVEGFLLDKKLFLSSFLPNKNTAVAEGEGRFLLLAKLSGWPRPGQGIVEISLGPTEGRELGWKLLQRRKGSVLASKTASFPHAGPSLQELGEGRMEGQKGLFRVLLRDLVEGQMEKYL